MKEKIGIYLCECGPNIKDAMNLEDVADFARRLEGVSFVRQYNLLCSQEGKEILKRDIEEQGLTRIVIGACSPKEHEITFKNVVKSAGLNPYLLQIANIREQCAWVIKDKSLATAKAKVMLKAAVKRVILHEPLEVKEIECQADVLVVGAGIAGISAALTLAQKNRKVYLVEKSPCIGGKTARYEEVFPNLECASCMLDPELDKVLHDERIELLTYSEVQEVLGYYGNFIVKVNKKARFVDKSCIGCGACFEVCPVNVQNEYNEGLDERKAIYIPYAGSLPNIAVIDREHCIRFKGKECNACKEACPFGSINYDEEDSLQELNVGAIVLAVGFDIFNPAKAPQYGSEKVENVHTSLEFERLLSSTGPTKGKILLKNNEPPQKIAIIHCVGSRNKDFNEYCSEVCCMSSLKYAHLAKKKLPDVSIIEFYSDFCLPGKRAQGFFNKVYQEKGLNLVQTKTPDSIEVVEGKDGKILIRYTDVKDKRGEVTCDMVVLSSAIEPVREAGELANIFDISRSDGGFFTEEHVKLAPVSTIIEGIFIAGCAQGPKDIASSVTQGQASAGRVLSRLIPGEKLTLEPIIAVIDENLCSGCKVCISFCPYKAITYDGKEKRSVINEVLCKGCGVCVSGCASGAATARHFTDRQITEEIKGLLK